MADTNRRVQDIIEEFVEKLTQVARKEAARVVLGGIGSTGRARSASSDGRGGKRSSAKIEALQEKFLAFVKGHPGLRIEQINEQLGTKTKDVALPIRKLIAGKQIRTQGTRRATTYFAGGASAAKGASRKAPKAKRGKRSKR
jgi:hypothetical protein